METEVTLFELIRMYIDTTNEAITRCENENDYPFDSEPYKLLESVLSIHRTAKLFASTVETKITQALDRLVKNQSGNTPAPAVNDLIQMLGFDQVLSEFEFKERTDVEKPDPFFLSEE